ncbi:MAG: LPS-assembly protein LptD [Deferrisomatales bacterium]
MRAGAPLLAALVLAGSAAAQERISLLRPNGGAVEIRAETLSVREQGARLEAAGQVAVRWEGYRLTADRVTYDREGSRAEAEGDVTLEDPEGNLLRGQRLSLNLETQEGEVEDATLWIPQEGYRVWGQRFRKTGPVSYQVERGGFTACDGTWPSWRVEARQLEVELEGYLVGRGAAFWVEGAPVVYTPYVVFPVKRERQSGFLIPRVGFSDRDGLLWALPYYWAFADNADATLRLEHRSRRGWAQGAELRYIWAEGHEGTVEATFLRDRREKTDRYTVKAEHRSRFSEAARARLKIDYQGDRRYLQDVGDTLDERGVARLESFLLASADSERGTAFGFARYLQSLETTQGDVLQTFPSVGFLGRETPLVGPIVWDPTVRATRFWRPEGERGERLELTPALGADLGLGGIGLSARAGYRENLYYTDDETVSRGATTAEAGASATLVRGYGTFLHTLEPGARLRWEEEGRGGTPPTFDEADAFGRRSAVAFLVQSRLLHRGDLSPAVALDLERELDTLRGEWGPWRGEAAAWLGDWGHLRGDGELAPEDEDPWRRWSAGATVSDRRGDRAFASYRYLKKEAGYADGGVEIAVTRELALQYRHRYSVRESQTLEEGYGVHLKHPCWELLVTLSRNHRQEDGRDERRYFVVLNLKGLGRLGTLRGLLP